jgi:hypothetical protein
MSRFMEDLTSLLNAHSTENGANTPDFILAKYMKRCLEAFEEAVNKRDDWYGVRLCPGMPDEGKPGLQKESQ